MKQRTESAVYLCLLFLFILCHRKSHLIYITIYFGVILNVILSFLGHMTPFVDVNANKNIHTRSVMDKLSRQGVPNAKRIFYTLLLVPLTQWVPFSAW